MVQWKQLVGGTLLLATALATLLAPRFSDAHFVADRIALGVSVTSPSPAPDSDATTKSSRTSPSTEVTTTTEPSEPTTRTGHESRMAKSLKFIHIPGTDSFVLEEWGKAHGLHWGRLQENVAASGTSSGACDDSHDWFLVVRHPVDRFVAVSRASDIENEADLNAFLQGLLNRPDQSGFRPMAEYFDARCVQHILRYESLDRDFSRLCQTYDLPVAKSLANRLPRKAVTLWPSTLQMIYSRFSEDFARFNYSMEEILQHLSTTSRPKLQGLQQGLVTSVRRKELKFIHITKTGGTAIEDWGKDHGLKWGRFHTEYRAPGLAGSPWHHPFPSLPSSLRQRFDWFMVVRDPVHRAISEYYCPWTGTKTPQSDTEDSFNHFLQGALDGTRWLHPGSFREMSKYLDPSSVQHILHFETLSADLKRLLPLYGIHFDGLPKKNQATGEKFDSKNLHPKTLQLIRSKYAADFRNFNYTPPER